MDAAPSGAQNPAYSLLPPRSMLGGALVPTDWIPLDADEPVGLVAPSGVVDPGRLDHAVGLLRSAGREVLLAPNLSRADGYLAGTDAERVAGLEWVLDRGVRVLLAARGGSGATRILEALPWPRLVDRRACFVGFSDLTAIMNPLVDRGGAAQVHGPMLATEHATAGAVSELLRLLSSPGGSEWTMEMPPSAVVRPGTASGPARGGNLAVMAALVGTPFAPMLDGAVVFLEDVSEPLYRLDRMLTQLASSGTFRGVKALVCGKLCDCPGVEPGASRWRELLLEGVPGDAVVLEGLDFGHGRGNAPFPLGVTVELDTGAGRVAWSM